MNTESEEESTPVVGEFKEATEETKNSVLAMQDIFKKDSLDKIRFRRPHGHIHPGAKKAKGLQAAMIELDGEPMRVLLIPKNPKPAPKNDQTKIEKAEAKRARKARKRLENGN